MPVALSSSSLTIALLPRQQHYTPESYTSNLNEFDLATSVCRILAQPAQVAREAASRTHSEVAARSKV
jgi:hypothetical protein